MKKRLTVFIIIFLALAILVPFIINESYKANSGYVTMWGPAEALSYFGTVIAAIGSIFLGVIAIKQSNNANDLSQRLLALEENKLLPQLSLCALTKATRNACSCEEVLQVCVGDLHSKMNENWEIDGDQGLVLWFKIKNLGDNDVLDIMAECVKVTIINENNKPEEHFEYSTATICNSVFLEGRSSIPVVFILPNVFVEAAKLPNRTVAFNPEFLVMAADGRKYNIAFSCEIVNAYSSCSLSPIIINKGATTLNPIKQEDNHNG